jgi:hypothetical protein
MKEKLIDFYDNPMVRSLIQLVPFGFGAGFDVVMIRAVERLRNRRLRVFFDELSSGGKKLTKELIENQDFLHAYFCTVNAVLKTRREEKIQKLACLFAAVTSDSEANILSDFDEFEDYLSILDELSWQQMAILESLYLYESKHPIEKERRDIRMRANKKFWKDFQNEIHNRFGVSTIAFDAVMIRIERTGCLYYPRAAANDLRPQSGMTTQLFHNLRRLIYEVN